jgi:hypothetical protein
MASSLHFPGRLGYAPEERFAYVTNRSGGTLALNELVQFDHTDAGNEYTDPNETTPVSVGLGTANTWLASVKTPGAASATVPGVGGQVDATTVGTAPAVFAVVVDLLEGAGADNTVVRVQLSGIVRIKPVSGGALTYGRAIFPVSGAKTVTNTLTKGLKCLGFALATSGTNDLATTCVFNGEYGYGIAYLDAVA